MNFENLNLWLGTDASRDQVVHLFLEAYKSPTIMQAIQAYASSMGTDVTGQQQQDTNPVVFQQHGNVAILSISGPMITDSSAMSRYFGIVSYQDICERLYQVGEMDDIKVVMTNWNTQGGAAIGMGGASNTIRTFSDNVIPVIGYTDRVAASSGYWLLASSAKAYLGTDAQVGSLGAVAFHSEFSKMRAANGITDTVVRSNANKCLINDIEPLSATGRAELQASVDHWQDLFATGIAQLRDMSVATVNKTIANGKMYNCDDAVKLNMADGVMSFEQCLAKLSNGVK